MANEVVRTINFHKPVFEDGKYVGTVPTPERDYDIALHWNPEDDEFEIWAEGDVCIEDGIYTYGVFEFGLNAEEARELYDELGRWLNDQDAGSKVV